MHKAFNFTNELRHTIVRLAKQPDIHSVACYFDDFNLWEELLKEQVRRAEATGLDPQDALYLCGPDTGVRGITCEPGLDDECFAPIPDEHGRFAPDQWGGKMHIPYEGITGADLFVLPHWHNAFPESLRKPGAKLRYLVRKPCNYVLTNRNFGEFECATRTRVAQCWLYKSNGRYEEMG